MKSTTATEDERRFPIVYWIVWVLTFIFAALAVIVFILFLMRQNNIRCFTALGIHTQPAPTPDGGQSIGRIEFLTDTVEMRVRWWLLNGTTPERISFRGPLDNPMSITAPYALTVCGGDSTQSCESLEQATCVARGLTFPCGLLEASVMHLDSSDTALEPHFWNITGFLKQAKQYPEFFYLSVEETDSSGETQRGAIGATCSKDLL